jgi:heme-degrading monooxygenase HmoA
LTGFIIGLLCKSDLVKEDIYRRGYMNLCISGAVVIIISWIGLSSIPNNVKYYVDQMKIFSIRENEALAAYNNLSLDGPKEDILYDINERGIYYWEENVNLLNNLEKVSLPDAIEERNKQLKKYCNLRNKNFSYLLAKLGAMIIVHDIFVCKPGNASKLAKQFKEAMKGLSEVVNIMTDMTGQYNRVIMVSQYENLTAYEKSWEKYKEDTEENRKMSEKMAGYTDMYLTGSREIYQTW